MSLVDIKVQYNHGELTATVKAWPFIDMEIVTTNSEVEQVVQPIAVLKNKAVKWTSKQWFKAMISKT